MLKSILNLITGNPAKPKKSKGRSPRKISPVDIQKKLRNYQKPEQAKRADFSALITKPMISIQYNRDLMSQ